MHMFHIHKWLISLCLKWRSKLLDIGFIFILPDSIRDATEKRRSESAGTFNIASDLLKPRISHTREPRLSKMQLVTRKTIRLKHNSTVNTFLHTFSLMTFTLAILLSELWLVSAMISLWYAEVSRAIILHLAHTGVHHMVYGPLRRSWQVICQWSTAKSRYFVHFKFHWKISWVSKAVSAYKVYKSSDHWESKLSPSVGYKLRAL